MVSQTLGPCQFLGSRLLQRSADQSLYYSKDCVISVKILHGYCQTDTVHCFAKPRNYCFSPHT